ncbi:MAG: Ig-like domain-containing protein [Bacilli bacterium]|nr:Ig-like domain-containing protein [Bacilli bacterium]
MDKRKTLGVLTATSLTAVGLALSTLAFSNYKTSTRLKASDYTLTLNSSNGISGTNVTTTQNVTTDSGAYEVEFGYTNCSSYASGHATINAGGKIVNNDHIRSIYSLVADFETSGELKFRTSYDGATWGGYTSMKASEEYQLGSNPYYVEFTTDGTHSVNLKTVQFSYTCEENPNAIPQPSDEYQYEKVTSSQTDWSGDYILVNEASSTSGRVYRGLYYNTSSSNYEYESLSISNGVITETPYTTVTLTAMSGGYSMLINSGTNSGKYAYGDDGQNHMNYGTTASACTVIWNSNGYAEIAWIGDSGNHILRMNDGSNGSTATYQFRFFKPTSSYGGNATDAVAASAAVKLYKKVTIESVQTPVDENGFTAVDSNKDNYTTNSIFDSANGLTVKATFTDGSTQTLSKGADGYSYVIKNSSGTAIDTSKAFGTEDVYTLFVSYKNYIPVQITLNVGLYTYLTGITPSMTNTAFNTADVLSNTISNTLSAALTYNVSSLNKSVNYGNFSANNLAVTLIDPNGVTKSISSAFGVAGTWTLKVSSTEDTSIYGTIELTVSAIAVTDISLDNSALTLYVGGTAQLTATVNPTNATNQGIAWSSDDTTVATVSETGLVTAKKVGTATITATSSDGGKTATCAITVKKQSATQATITASNPQTDTSKTVTYSSSGFTTNGITLTDGSLTQAYGTSDGSYRMSSKNNAGEIVLYFDEVLITGITLNAKVYDSNASVNISTSANTTGETVTISEDGDYVTTAFASDTEKSTSITISNAKKNRYYFVSLTITCGVAEPVYPTAISLENTTCNVGYTTQLTPVFTPSDTNQTTLVWESSNTSVATVSQTGLVTGVAAGTSTITATGYDENDQPVVGTCTVTVTTVAVTGVSLNKTSSDLSLGATLTLEATVAPANATNKNVTWTSSNTSVATVSAGTVTAKAVGSTTITVKTVDGNKTATCAITVVEAASDDYTIMIYMCGADLESDSGLATGDLAEIFNVTGQPDGVNIIVETGGATSWKNYNISANYLTRYHVANQGLVKDTQLTKASMGLQSTFQSFLEWGMTEYPAKKTGVIMWNHGGALDGCCFDENFNDDPITNDEANAAYAAAFSNVNRTENLEWIGYDACLMAVQDVAEFNSHYFNYMVCSQETEGGYGWDYDGGWLKNLYNNPTGITTSNLLTQICTTFIADNTSESTLSVLDLTKMSAYKTAWETVASELTSIINSSSKWTTFKNVVNQCKKFGYYSDYSQYNGGYVYDVFDAQDLITKCQSNSTYSSCSWSALQTAFNNLVVCSKYTSDYSGSHGLNFFCPISGINSSSYYSTSVTNFTTWRTLCFKY